MESEKFLLAKLLNRQYTQENFDAIKEAEYKIYSQFGDDGIIQYLINKLDIKDKTFIEFGVENYRESNTRFLLENNNWSGFVMDGSPKNIEQIETSSFYWRHDLMAKSAFITADNINELILNAGFTGNIGILHVDIDGNDYYVWKAIDVVTPSIAIIEYNSVFGKERAITIPYDPNFQRTKAHYSNLYAGSSLLSLIDLSKEKGYSFIGSNSAGNNAYFIRKELVGEIKEISIDEGYEESKFRESRDRKGRLTFLRGIDRLNFLKSEKLQVFNTRTNKLESL